MLFANSWFASAWASSTRFIFVANDDRTETALAPSVPISWKIGTSAAKPPCSLNERSTVFTAVFASSLSSLVNASTSMFAYLANVVGSSYIFIMNVWNAVADISTFIPAWSRADAYPSVSDMEIPICAITPASLCVKSTRYASDAVEACPKEFTAEPIDRKDFSMPIVFTSPNTSAIFPIFLIAPSPRSSPSATFIWLAARTNCITFSLPVMPSLPASLAKAFRASLEVRVSIVLNSSFSAATSSLVSPVVFITSE